MTSRELKAKIAYYNVYSGYSKEYLAKVCGVSLSTFYVKLNEPSKFSLREISKLAKTIGLTDQEKLKLMVA